MATLTLAMTQIEDLPRLELVRASEPEGRVIDHVAAERAATELISALGADLSDGHRPRGTDQLMVSSVRASSKSAAVSPPAECVARVRRTWFQPWTRMSG